MPDLWSAVARCEPHVARSDALAADPPLRQSARRRKTEM